MATAHSSKGASHKPLPDFSAFTQHKRTCYSLSRQRPRQVSQSCTACYLGVFLFASTRGPQAERPPCT
ncbi:hypothetical protein CGMCC3_g16675 [Colletotrichum fructicola]|nr:uncharacterized protein CGMCC3_g16675 [Colletotrichum fructicola]KAE9567165.1 hypothetical protein CGMCC3_g16675 [Colletotrichum fructicola]